MAASVDELVLKLHSIQAVKFGKFKLKSGIDSPVYFDLRVIISYPDVMKQVADFLWRAVEQANCTFDNVCGVPYTALPLATLIAAEHDVPMLIRRKEAKDYGTKKILEGHFSAGQTCLVVEDVVTSGSSVLDTVTILEQSHLVVRDAVVLLDREQGGRDMLKQKGINMHSICGLSKLLDILHAAGRVDDSMVQKVREFIQQNKFSPAPPVDETKELNGAPHKRVKKSLTYRERSELCSHPVSRKLFAIMDEKKSNLAFSADVTSASKLLQLAETVGPHICILKTHVDILEDFSSDFTQQLQKIADKHRFLIFEDRKFADIGNTVRLQYSSGLHHIADWSHLVNAHPLPGPGIVDGLKQVGIPKQRGCVLIAEMSSKDCLIDKQYTEACVKLAEEHTDFVLGFICQSAVSSDARMIHMTPGVRLSEGGDQLGQQYTTPQYVIGQQNCDVIIVGRGILSAEDPGKAAELYQSAGFQAYLDKLS